MIVNFSQFDCGEKPTLVLKNLDGTAIQTLGCAFEIEADLLYNEISTLTFKIPAQVDGELVPKYEDVVGMRIVDLIGCGQFVLVDPEEEFDGIKKIKTCKAYSLEYEFMKKMIYLEAGTYNFYSGIDTSDPDTIVGRIRECLPEWRFDIDESLIGKYRTFDDINKNVYDFIKSDAQKKYGCVFDFDTYERIVHVIDVSTFVPTKQVYLSSNNLINKIKTNEDSENIITRLDVNGAEDVTIRSVNPTGTNKIYDLDYFMTEKNFTSDFIAKWRQWEADCEAKQSLYYDITMSYNMKLLAILTKEAEISDLEAELVSKENIQAVTIQGIAQNLKKESDLDSINSEISSLKNQISGLKNDVASMKESASEIHSERENINKALAFENYFTENEMVILRRYFIDDILQDNSFVAETAATYIEEDYSFVMNGSSISLSGAESITEATDSLGNRVVSFVGGSLILESLSAKMVRGTLYFEADRTIVFSGYADNGTIGDSKFSNGSITVSGDYSSVSVGDTFLSCVISDGRFYFTEKCSEYKQHQIEWELYAYGKQVLHEKASPTYNFDVECCNFLKLEDFLLFRNQLTLGQRVYLYLDEKVLEPFVVSVHVNFDDPTDFSIEFSSIYAAFDQSFHLAKLLDESVSTGKTLSYKSGMYSSFVNSGASTAVKDFMDSALDISKNAVLSSENQAISFDDTGIRIRKWADDSHTTYAPEEIWIVDNVIAFTEDNWATSKMAIGKIFDPNLMSVSNPTGMAYGIVADYLVGKIIAGQNLVIQATAEDGKTVTFKVDGSGAHLYNAEFNIISENKKWQFAASPEYGFGIGTYPLMTVDDNGNTLLDEDKAKFWVDSSGNVHFKGMLDGATGVFKGQLKVGGNDKDGYNFFVNELGEVTAKSGTFSGNIEANDLFLKNKNEYVSILNEAGKIKSDWVESLSVSELTTGAEDDGDYGTFYINISGRTMKYYKEDGDAGVLLGRISASAPAQGAKYFEMWGTHIDIHAGSGVESGGIVLYPQIELFDEEIALWGADNNTYIRINRDGEGKIELYGDVYVNDTPYGVAVFG